MIVASARRDDDVVKMLDAMVTRKMEMEMAEMNGGREKAKWREEIVANDWRRQNWREGEWRTFGEPIGDNGGKWKIRRPAACLHSARHINMQWQQRR